MSDRRLTFLAALVALMPAACTTPGTVGGPALPATFVALGTEPFWAAKVDGNVLVFRTPEDQVGRRMTVVRRARGPTIAFSGFLGGSRLRLMIARNPCSDGMSDTAYDYTAELRLGPQVLKGCARP